MSAHHQGCKWHGHELRHEVSSSVCGCDDQLMQHKPECPASWGVGEMPEGPCTFCEMLSACEQRVANEIWGAIREGSQYKSGFEGGLDAAREAVAAKAMHSPKCFALLPDFDERDCNCAVAYSLAAIDALREEQK